MLAKSILVVFLKISTHRICNNVNVWVIKWNKYNTCWYSTKKYHSQVVCFVSCDYFILEFNWIFFFTFHSDLPMLIFLKFRSRAWLRNDKLIDKKIRLCLSLMSGEIIIHKLIIESLMRYEWHRSHAGAINIQIVVTLDDDFWTRCKQSFQFVACV